MPAVIASGQSGASHPSSIDLKGRANGTASFAILTPIILDDLPGGPLPRIA